MIDENSRKHPKASSGFRRLKVVHIITRLELGGAQVNTIYTYQNLDKNHFEPYLLSGPGGLLNKEVEKDENFFIIKSLGRPIHPLNDFKAIFQLRRALKQIKPDIVHTHSSKAGIIGRLVAFFLRVPVVIHSVHGFSFSPFQSFLKRMFYVMAEKVVARMTDCFVFVSRDDIEIARQKRLISSHKKNWVLIRSGFPLRKFLNKVADVSPERQAYKVAPVDFVCGVIAPFKTQKGLFHLVEIAGRVIRACPDPRVVFIVAGDGSLRGELEARIKAKGLEKHFRLPGFVFDIEKIIDIFDIGVSTALWEGLPQGLVQMRLKKKAVVVSNIPGNREIIKENQNGFLVDVQDYDLFAERILDLIGQPAERARLEQYSDEDFSAWDADYMVNEQEKLYNDYFFS